VSPKGERRLYSHKGEIHKRKSMYTEQSLLRPAPCYTRVQTLLIQSVLKIIISFTSPFKNKSSKKYVFQRCISSPRIALDLCLILQSLTLFLQSSTVIFRSTEQSQIYVFTWFLLTCALKFTNNLLWFFSKFANGLFLFHGTNTVIKETIEGRDRT